MGQETTDTDFFVRNIGAITAAQQHRLQRSTVTVIGCGGLGGYVIEELVRLGLGRLRICDPDRFTASNINRQLHAGKNTLGQNKAAVISEHVRALHGQTIIMPVTDRFQLAAEQLFVDADVVVDCLDTPGSRHDLADLCRQYSLPLVHGAVVQWYGQVGVQLPGTRLVQTLYPDPGKKQLSSPAVLSCTVALTASLQVCETCKLLLGLPSALRNSWMSIDLKRLSFDISAPTV